MENETIYDFFLRMLQDHGLFENEAAAVMEIVKANPVNEAMTARWNERIDDYPPIMKSVLWLTVKKGAVEWIDENKPEHWARALFVEKVTS